MNLRLVVTFSAYLILWLAAGCLPAASADLDTHSPTAGIQQDRNGTYTADKWTYTYTITNPGTRSEGAMGQLFYAGRLLPLPDHPGDYYDTPLGRFYHVGMPVVPWGDHGWMPADPSMPAARGNPLPVPDTAAKAKERAVQQMDRLLKKMTAEGAKSPYLQDPLQDDYLSATDPWDTPYKIFQDLRGGEGAGLVARLELTSAGADQQFDTNDDIVCTSKFIRISDPVNEPVMSQELPESVGSPEVKPTITP